MATMPVISPIIRGMGRLGDRVTNLLARVYKREILRRMPPEFLNELARIKLEIVVFEGTPYERTKVIENLADALTGPDVKALSYVKTCDQTSIGRRLQTDIFSFGIEDLDIADGTADDWRDVIVSIRYWYNAEGTAPESILISIDGSYTHVKVYADGALVYESTWNDAVGAWHTHYAKTVPVTTA